VKRTLSICLIAGVAAVGPGLIGCETMQKMSDSIGKSDEPNLSRLATIKVWDPVKQVEDPITVELVTGANDELKLAVKHIQNGESSYEKAKTALFDSKLRNARNPQTFLLLGLLHEYQGDNAAAIEAYNQSNILETSKGAATGTEARKGRERCEAKLAK